MSRVFPFGPTRTSRDRVIPSIVRTGALGVVEALVEALRLLPARARRFLADVLGLRALQAARERDFSSRAACRTYSLPGADLRATQAAQARKLRLPARDRRP